MRGGAITGEERLREKTTELYGAIQGYEGRSADYQVARIDSLKRELDDVANEFNALVAKDLADANAALAKKKMTPIHSITREEWDQARASTSQLTSEFYARLVKTPADGKAEALRQTQLAFLRASTSGAPSAANDRGLQVAKNSQPSSTAAGYSHPLFWAPFIPIGN
jgi:hypothetical protein